MSFRGRLSVRAAVAAAVAAAVVAAAAAALVAAASCAFDTDAVAVAAGVALLSLQGLAAEKGKEVRRTPVKGLGFRV